MIMCINAYFGRKTKYPQILSAAVATLAVSCCLLNLPFRRSANNRGFRLFLDESP